MNQKSNLPHLKKTTFAHKLNSLIKQQIFLQKVLQMKQPRRKEFSIDEKSDNQIKKREKHLEISIYALIIIVTVALMLIFFNLFLNG